MGKRISYAIMVVVVAALFLSGCAGFNAQQNQAAWQFGATTLGALAGQAIGNDTESTLIGAGIGYMIGGISKPFAYPSDYHAQAARNAVYYNQTVPYRTGNNNVYYTAEPMGYDGNCRWVEETEWQNGVATRKWTKRVCKGNTPWQPGPPR